MIDFEAQNTGPEKVRDENKETGFLAGKAGGIGITTMKTREVQEMSEITYQEVIEMGDRKNHIILAENLEPDRISMKSVYR